MPYPVNPAQPLPLDDATAAAVHPAANPPTPLDRLLAQLTVEPRQELETLPSAPRHVQLIDPSRRFARAVVYLPPPRVWPPILMDAWVLENIDTMAARIAVPSRVMILALEPVTASLQCHVCDLTVSALESLRRFVATDSIAHRLTDQSAAQAWQRIDASRHYTTFNHRHAYVDPELRMRVPPAWVPMLLPGVAGDADDFAFAALAQTPLESVLSPWLPVGLVDPADGASVAGGLSLHALQGDSWTDELTTWVLARTAEIHAAIGNRWQLSAALRSMQITLCAAPIRHFIDEQASARRGERMLRVIAAMQVLVRHHPAWGSLPAYHRLNAESRHGEQTHRIDAAQADPDRLLAQLLNAVETEGGDAVVSAFLRTFANTFGDE